MDIDTIAHGMKAYLEGRLPRYLDLLARMVAVNTFTENAAGIDRLADDTAAAFAQLGFMAEKIPSVHSAYGPHLLMQKPGGGARVCCISHLDTVFSAEEEVRNGFSFRIEKDRVYGPGVNDIKGGTVVLLMALEALREAAPEAWERLAPLVILNASEEVDSDDFGGLCRARVGNDCRACLVYEAGKRDGESWELVTARKGRAVFNITTTGRGAHAGANHENGASAVTQMAEAVQRLAAITDYGRGVTVNVGSLRGGTVVNRVPHEAVAEAEMRAFAPDAFSRALAAIRGLDGLSTVRSADGSFACTTRVELAREIPPWPENDATKGLFGIFAEAGARLGISLSASMRGGLSDGNYLWDLVPTIDGLGPVGGNAHCSVRSADGSVDQEYAVISSFIPKALLSALALLRIAGGKWLT